MKKYKVYWAGFTLIELLVVLVILAAGRFGGAAGNRLDFQIQHESGEAAN